MWKLLSNLVVDDISRVPEDLRGMYEQKDGKYHLMESMKATAKVVDGLGTALAKSRADVDAIKKNTPDLSPWKALAAKFGLSEDDVTPETLAEAIDAARKDKGNQTEIEKIKKAMTEGFNKQLKAKEDEIAGMGKSLSDYMIQNEALSGFAEFKGSSGLLLPHVMSKAKVIKEGDKWVPRVVDEAGSVVVGTDGSPLTIKGFIKNMKSDAQFARAFDSDAPSGGGSRGKDTQRPNPGQQSGQQSEASPVNKIAQGLRANPQGVSGRTAAA